MLFVTKKAEPDRRLEFVGEDRWWSEPLRVVLAVAFIFGTIALVNLVIEKTVPLEHSSGSKNE